MNDGSSEYDEDEGVKVITPLGKIYGTEVEAEDKDSKSYYAFKGIPYAEPPVGELRFKDPVPKGNWEEPFNASDFGAACVQKSFGEDVELEGEEDCLFVNVFTPRIPNQDGKIPIQSSLLPVIVFIHGGYFQFGNSDAYDPEFFMAKDVVFVTFNYRLGLLGFMSLGNHQLAGNMGLKDQLEVFKWVNANILSFGGDPSRVTIMGSDSGAASAHLHQLSYKGSGLYKGVVAMSGSAMHYANYMAQRHTERASKQIAERTECVDSDMNEVLECLQDMEAEELYDLINLELSWAQNLEDELNGNASAVLFFPVIDDYASSGFITAHPYSIMSKGTQKNLPLIMGSVKNEGALEVSSSYEMIEEFNANFTYHGPMLIHGVAAKDVTDKMKLVANVTRMFYAGEEFSQDNEDDLLNFFNDLYSIPMYHGLDLQSSSQSKPVYTYQLTHAPTTSLLSAIGEDTGTADKDWAPVHGDDQIFLFPEVDGIQGLGSDEDMMTSEILVCLLANFATHGDPSPFMSAKTPAWAPYTKANRDSLEIKPESEGTKGFGVPEERTYFWDKIFWEDYVKPEPTSSQKPKAYRQPKPTKQLHSHPHYHPHRQFFHPLSHYVYTQPGHPRPAARSLNQEQAGFAFGKSNYGGRPPYNPIG